MRVPTPSEPNLSTFPTYQVPQVSAMRGRAPPVQVARTPWRVRADSPSVRSLSVISGSSCLHHHRNKVSSNNNRQQEGAELIPIQQQQQKPALSSTSSEQNKQQQQTQSQQQKAEGNSNHNNNNIYDNVKNNITYNNNNLRMMMQSVTDNCLLNSTINTLITSTTVTVPIKQRNGDQQMAVAHNNVNNINLNNNDNMISNNDTISNTTTTNSDKLACKFGALLLHGQDIPKQKADDLETSDDCELLLTMNLTKATNNNNNNKIITPSISIAENVTIKNDTDDQNCGESDEDGQRTSRAYGPPLRLRGGGESSISTGTTGWGTPPSQQASNNNGECHFLG